MISWIDLFASLDYNPATGVWTRVETGIRADVSASNRGYRRVYWACKKHSYAHRLAWFYMTGALPTKKVDHEDLDGSNNRWKNLRLATSAQNGTNSRARKNNTSGHRGVYWNKAKGKWQAYICVNYKSKYLGRFDSFDEAVACRRVAAQKYFGEFARHD